MKKLALTGNIGAGKSTVAQMFFELGVHIIDTDKLAHDLIKPHTHVWKELFERFGKTILLTDGEVDRKRLAKLTFSSDQDRKFLENLIHPHIKTSARNSWKKLQKDNRPYCLLEVPLLFETHWNEEMDLSIVVNCEEELAIERAQENLNLTRKEVELRLQHQLPLAEKINRADVVIDNNDTLDQTKIQVERLFRKWNKGDFN